MRSMRFVFWLALPVLIVVGAAGAAGVASAQAPDVQQACTPDAMRLCGQFIPDRAKVEACMKVHRRQWSPECRAAALGGRRVATRGHRTYRHRTHHTRHHHGH
ncbi:MAG TPA: hypothetical protein VFA80_11335 [Xanthobacteraceae bacterium]|jgi:hypothetical protein|nr:hypothetical protein [Xanthobacteraceae bacterium]